MNGDHVAELAAAVTASLGQPVTGMTSLSGGDVADAYRVVLAGGRTVFAKTHRRPPPGFFTTEAAGLTWLGQARALPVPEVLAVGDGDGDGEGHGDGRRGDGRPALLVLEWIEEDRRARPDEGAFGRALAALHAAGAPAFGRQDRRTTGSRGLPNEPCSGWAEFYASQRLRPLAGLLRDADHLGDDAASRVSAGLESVAARAVELAGAPEPPARLHGDLWAGNRLVDRHGRSWLIDPACIGGHREFDLAMMRLFGGFAESAFAAYAEVTPLGDGWRERIPFHQLAPLAVHALKFGGGYGPALERALHQLGA